MSWVNNEMDKAQFGDKRLDHRVKIILDRMISQPTESVPAECRGWAETQAAYRFFANEKVTEETVLAPHQDATCTRMAEHKVVLCLQDTTELNYSGQTQTQGLGPLSSEEQLGLHLHPTLAVTPERLCLGVLDSLVWARSEADFRKKKDRGNKPIEEKESVRWIDGYRGVCEVSKTLPHTQCVYIADRESDIYDLFLEGKTQQHHADWLIRATHDRRVLDDEKIAEALHDTPTLGEIEFNLPPSHKRKQKHIRQKIKACRVKLQPPQRKGEALASIEITVLLAEEMNPPKEEEPITWILLSNLDINTLEEAIEKIEWYLCRWQIEIYFRILKSGCKVEKLQLEHIDRLRPALALYMIVAWRVLYLTMLGRECPDLPCDLAFETEEWQAIYIVTQRKPPPEKVPSINDMIRMMASFGGFLGRKSDGEPGPKTMWIGLRRARDFVLAIEAQKNIQKSTTCV